MLAVCSHLTPHLASLWPLRAAFAEFDPSDAKVMMDRQTGRSRGFGFVWFRDKRGLDDAIERLHNSELEGRRISVARAVPQVCRGGRAVQVGAGRAGRLGRRCLALALCPPAEAGGCGCCRCGAVRRKP